MYFRIVDYLATGERLGVYDHSEMSCVVEIRNVYIRMYGESPLEGLIIEHDIIPFIQHHIGYGRIPDMTVREYSDSMRGRSFDCLALQRYLTIGRVLYKKKTCGPLWDVLSEDEDVMLLNRLLSDKVIVKAREEDPLPDGCVAFDNADMIAYYVIYSRYMSDDKSYRQRKEHFKAVVRQDKIDNILKMC
jgi:hypothetical protein